MKPLREGGQGPAGACTEAVKCRYELLLIPAKLVCSGRRKIVKLADGAKFASFLRQAYQRLLAWLGRTAPQLDLTMDQPPVAPVRPPRPPHKRNVRFF